MPSPDVLDFPALLAPISADKPTGVDPRSDISPNSPYFKIKDARRSAREAERQAAIGSDGPAPDPPDWKEVRSIATEVLKKQAKDLEIAAYLIEALLRLDGVAGLRDGFRLTRELVEKYWDNLYPLPDEDGLVARIAPLTGLNGEDADGTLIAPMIRVPLTAMTSHGQFCQIQYNEANALKKIGDPKVLQKKVDAGGITLEKFQKAVTETPAPFYLGLVDDLNAGISEFVKLGEVLDKRCAGQGPPTSKIRETLEEILGIVKTVAPEKLKVVAAVKPAPAAVAGKPGPADAPSAPQPIEEPGVLHTREQALESLQKVVEFFRGTEPHSPISYTLEQVIRWAKMPFPELWTELIADEAPRKNVFKQVGVRPEDAAKGKK